MLKDPATQKIAARAVIRLLSDGEKPVLFVEPHYLTYQNPELSKAIDEYAIQLGERLKIPVYSKAKGVIYKEEDLPSGAKNLHVLGLSTPFEYCDSAGGMQVQPYQIVNALPISIRRDGSLE